MDPLHEQRLINEVIYLHSLWHQGPPRKSNPNPNSKSKHNPPTNLHPSNSTPFKKNTTTKKKNSRRNKNANNNKPESDPPKISDVEWPCENPITDTPPATSGWPTLKPYSATAKPASAEEQAKFLAFQVQQKGLEACRGFLSRNSGSDSDEEEESDDDDSVEMNGNDECEEYDFFLKLFTDDSKLRSFYEKNWEGGEFCCLVCGGVGKKVNKRFKDCVALVQHSTAISKNVKKRAHRAYGKVICKVLGWEINRLPTIVLSMGDSLGRNLTKTGEFQENDGGDKYNSSVREQENDIVDKSVGSSNGGTGKLIFYEESLKEDGGGTIGVEIRNKLEEVVVLDDLKGDGANQNKGSLEKYMTSEGRWCWKKEIVVSVGTNRKYLQQPFRRSKQWGD